VTVLQSLAPILPINQPLHFFYFPFTHQRAAVDPRFLHTAWPVFGIRGLQPFHDFFSGPDWWSEDEHKRVLESISLMKGNFIAFHTVRRFVSLCCAAVQGGFKRL
jgi:hypothetical protein